MEALDCNSRQSGILSLINRDPNDRSHTKRTYTSAPNMAAAAMVSPTASLYSNPPPSYSGWTHPPSNIASGLISPPESRRTSDNQTEPPPPIQTSQHRQSLPSIHEALSSGPKPNPYASPVSASLPQAQHQLSYSQPQPSSIPRSYPPEHASYPPQPRHPSPLHQVHPQSNPFSRPDSIPVTFVESARGGSLTSLQSAPGPPHNPYAHRPYEPSRYEQDHRAMPNGYASHPRPSPQQQTYQSGPTRSGMLQSGQSPYSDTRYQNPPKDFRTGLKRNLDVWGFGNDLGLIDKMSTLIQEWSRHFNQIASEQQGPMPDRMPPASQCQEMIDNTQRTMEALLRMKEVIHDQEYASEQRKREYDGKQPRGYDDEMSMYGDDMKSQGFGGLEGKKRRGRAAPPGRCHSCNRAETPEWRRGPDGARTLCNACGLHYAKLTRKNTMKQSQGSNGSSLRPKSMDDHSP